MEDTVDIMDIVPVSTTDWKGHCSTVVFFAGCPMNCVYCSNHAQLNDGKYVNITDIEDQITKASKFVDSVVFSGGEPMMHANALERLIDHARSLGLKTAVHTNGYYPNVLEELLAAGKLDGVMLDIKAPLVGGRYGDIVRASSPYFIVRVEMALKTLSHIKPTYYEVRTVVFNGINDNEQDVFYIASYAQGSGADSYVVVQGIADIAPEKLKEVSYDRLTKLAKFAANAHPNVWVRSKLGERRVEAQQV
jgi:pyruvate formate lyase activating enzyme